MNVEPNAKEFLLVMCCHADSVNLFFKILRFVFYDDTNSGGKQQSETFENFRQLKVESFSVFTWKLSLSHACMYQQGLETS